MQPHASAGANATVQYKTLVTLDGSAADDDGPQLSYQWTTDSVPSGSTAALNDPTVAMPSFFADVPGQYKFTLTATDTLKTSVPVSVTITAINGAPIASVNAGDKIFTGTSYPLDGSHSFDPNNDPLTYQWTVVSAPQGSAAAPASPTSVMTTFVPDVPGTYKISLVVSDGTSSSGPASLTLDVYYALGSLPGVGFIRDAKYSKQLDRIVMVGPVKSLYIYDPTTGIVQTIALNWESNTVSISPDGLTAVVGHDNFITVIDIQNASTALTRGLGGAPLAVKSVTVVQPGNGYAYVFPDSQTRYIRNVPLNATDPIVNSTDNTFQDNAQWVPGTQTIYATSGNGTLAGIYRYDLQSSIATLTRSVSSGTCNNLWVSDDGLHIFTRCGEVFSISNTAASDMVLEGSLSGESATNTLTQSTAAGKLVALPGNSPADQTARFYNYPSLAFDRAMTLPKFLVNGTVYDGLGVYAFIRADNQSVTIIERANTTSSLIYGVGTYPL